MAEFLKMIRHSIFGRQYQNQVFVIQELNLKRETVAKFVTSKTLGGIILLIFGWLYVLWTTYYKVVSRPGFSGRVRA